jgi:hypothetical protein
MSIYRMQDLSKFPDCCALSERGRCTRLTVYNCQGEQCRFKRTCKEDTESLQYAHNRLSTLDISVQLKIAKKYYGGTMPCNRANERLKASNDSVEDY